MKELNSSYRAGEIALANRIAGSLSNSLPRKYNVHLNLFYLQNPILAFALLNCNAFHFSKIRSLSSDSQLQNELSTVLNYWAVQGVEVELKAKVDEFSTFDQHSANVLNFVGWSEMEQAISYFSGPTELLVYKKIPYLASEDIWTFMLPLWKLFDILGYSEVSVASDRFYLLTCKTRNETRQ